MSCSTVVFSLAATEPKVSPLWIVYMRAALVVVAEVVVCVVWVRVDVDVLGVGSVVPCGECPCSPDLISKTATVAAARNATGAAKRLSSLRRAGSTYQPATAQTSRA